MAGKRPESVLVVVHTRAGEVLLLRRADVGASAEETAFWQSVTGSLEPGETPLQAARRELREETGLSPDGLVDCRRRRRFPIRPEWRARYAPDVTHNVEHEFRLLLNARTDLRLDPREHMASRWLPRAEAVERAASWTDRAAIRALPVPPAQATVVVVHGLWLGPHAMRPLARRLRAAGFRTVLFRYRSTGTPPAEVARRLAARVDRIESATVHFVAHSLGGLVLSHLFNAYRPGRIGRSVLVGSPMRGSAAARAMARRGLGGLLGAAREQGLDGAAPAWPREMPVTVLAGIVGCGPVAALLPSPPLAAPHDGTVAVRETFVAGARRVPIRATHVGLLFSRRTAAAVVASLRGDPPP